MKAAFSDLDYHFNIIGVDGNVVKDSHFLSGTHTEYLDLFFMRMGVIPPNGKSFSMVQETAEITLRDGKAVSYKLHTTEGNGLLDLFAQLGVQVPTG